MNGHLSDCSHAMQRTIQQEQKKRFHTDYQFQNLPINLQISEFTCPHKCLIDLLHKVYFQRSCLDATAWTLEVILQMVDTPFSANHSPVLPLRTQKMSLQSTPAVFKLTGEETHLLLSLFSPFPHLSSLLEVRLHLSNPHFFLTIPLSGWLVFSASSSTKETKEAGPLSLFAPCREQEKGV